MGGVRDLIDTSRQRDCSRSLAVPVVGLKAAEVPCQHPPLTPQKVDHRGVSAGVTEVSCSRVVCCSGRVTCGWLAGCAVRAPPPPPLLPPPPLAPARQALRPQAPLLLRHGAAPPRWQCCKLV